MEGANPSGGTNWTEHEEYCAAWMMGKRVKDMSYDTFKSRRVPIVPDLYIDPGDKIERMLQYGKDGIALFDALELVK